MKDPDNLTKNVMLYPERPALMLAPMDGITDAPMRALQGEAGAFTFAVSEFLRVSGEVPPPRVFLRHIPELRCGARTPSGLPVQVQILGGDAGRMACAAVVACSAGARAIDINFGCPAPTVNRHDGGASLLKHPKRIREVVQAVRDAVSEEIPVSAKLRLGWDAPDSIFENAEMAAQGGASWITIHARTRVQGYAPPVHWKFIGQVRERLGLPIVANGDIWTIEGLRCCREETGCLHFMLGRGALANPLLPYQAAVELGMLRGEPRVGPKEVAQWLPHLRRLVDWIQFYDSNVSRYTVFRLKQWLKIASLFGEFPAFEAVKRAESTEALLASLAEIAKQDAMTEGRDVTVTKDF